MPGLAVVGAELLADPLNDSAEVKEVVPDSLREYSEADWVSSSGLEPLQHL